MNRRAVLSLVGIMLIALIGASGAVIHSGAQAKDSPGCEGLAAYRSAMFAVGKAFVAQEARDGLGPRREITTYSSSDWTASANDLAAYQDDLKTVTPPDWLKTWHEVKIEGAGLGQQVSLAAANGGRFAILAFKDPSAKLDTENTAAKEAAIKTCSDFKQFAYDWDAIDGDVNGTPVATPSD
jgi:hypothetical protein